MKSLLLAGISLLSIRYVLSHPNKNVNSKVPPYNFAKVLRWLHDVSENYMEYQEILEVDIKRLTNNLDLEGFDHIETYIYVYIYTLGKFYSLFVDVDAEKGPVKYELEHPLYYLINLFFPLEEAFTELLYATLDWRAINRDRSYKIESLKEEAPLAWFIQHGFKEATLKDVEPTVFLKALNGIFTSHIFSNRLRSICATIHFLKPKNNPSVNLPWLTTFVRSSEAIDMVENYLKGDESKVPVHLANEIVENLRKLGEENSPLRKLIGTYVEEGLHNFVMIRYEDAVFEEKHVPRYMKLMVGICANAIIDLVTLAKTLGLHEPIGYIDTVQPGHYQFSTSKINVKDLSQYAKTLIMDGGPLKRLNMALAEYNKGLKPIKGGSTASLTRNPNTSTKNVHYDDLSPEREHSSTDTNQEDESHWDGEYIEGTTGFGDETTNDDHGYLSKSGAHGIPQLSFIFLSVAYIFSLM